MTKNSLDTCLPRFARHGSYPPKWGWLPKVHAAISQDPQAFSRPDAPVLFAVGSSMVPSMRFWALAFGLIEPVGDGHTPARYAPTERGRWLLDEEGADPWLEEPGTLWLLHWWLLSARPCHVPTFWHLFADWGLSRFSRADLRASVQRAADRSGWRTPSDNVVDRDLTALLAMYAPPTIEGASRASIEEILSSPFRQLNILTFDDAPGIPAFRAVAVRGRQIRLQRNRPDGAPAAILTYACLDYARSAGHQGPGTISLAALASAPGGPGRLLLANEPLLRGAVERAARTLGSSLSVIESPVDGQTLLTFTEEPRALAERVLTSHYK